MTLTGKQRKEVKKGLLVAVKQADAYKGKRYETIRVSFPSGVRRPLIITAKEDKRRHVEGLYRDALITVWETSLRQIRKNILYLHEEFKSDKQVQFALDKIEKFFNTIKKKK